PTEGMPDDAEKVERDQRKIVRAYSPSGSIYQPGPFEPRLSDPDYLYVSSRRNFHPPPGDIDLIYTVHEGKPFRVGQIRVKGNSKTKDNVILRNMHFAPGQLFDAGEMRDAQ